MNQINANLILAPTRLNRPLPTLYARVLHSFVCSLSNIPDDVYSVVVRVFKTNGTEYFDVPCGRSRGGVSTATLAPGCFPTVGSSHYEIHGYDAQGNATALGMGYILIESFSTTAQPIDPGQTVPLYQVPDSSGVMHTIKAVPDGEGGYTTIIEDAN